MTTLDSCLFDPLDAGLPWRGVLEVTGAGGAWLQRVAESDARHVTVSWELTPPIEGVAEGLETLPWADLPDWQPY